MVKTSSITPVTPNNTPESSRVMTPPTKEKTTPAWTQPAGYSGKTASAVTGRIHTIGPRPAQHNDRPVSTKGLHGAIKTETTCPSSATQITITTRIRTYLRIMLFPDILGVPHCYHANAEFCWVLVCVTIHYYSLSVTDQLCVRSFLSVSYIYTFLCT